MCGKDPTKTIGARLFKRKYAACHGLTRSFGTMVSISTNIHTSDTHDAMDIVWSAENGMIWATIYAPTVQRKD